MPKLGELGDSVAVLRKMRDQLVQQERYSKIQQVEDERWESFNRAASKIACACEDRSLESLVMAARELKNRLRRPAVRKELARLEAKDEPREKQDKIPAKKDKNPTGECKCAGCGKIIDGSREPCVEDALCTRCALKNKVIPKNKQDKKKSVVTPSGGGGGGGGEPGVDQGPEPAPETSGGADKKESREGLRRRRYLR